MTEMRWDGLAGWILSRLRRGPKPRPRLSLLERIPLAPRQSLLLIEAEGRRFLVATSHDGAPSFYPLDSAAQPDTLRRTSHPAWRAL